MIAGIIDAGTISSDDNAVIARRLKKHDHELLHELIDTYQHRLMHYLPYRTRCRDEAEDLFQEV